MRKYIKYLCLGNRDFRPHRVSAAGRELGPFSRLLWADHPPCGGPRRVVVGKENRRGEACDYAPLFAIRLSPKKVNNINKLTD